MALRTQIAVLCLILGTVSANVFMNRRRHHGPPDIKDFQQILADMFHPSTMQGILQIKPMNHPGILGFGSFGGPGIGDYSDAMVGSNQGGYGLDDSLPMSPSLIEREDGIAQGPVFNFGENGLKYQDGPKTSQDLPEYNNEEREQDKHRENKPAKEVDESEAKEDDKKSDESTEKITDPAKNESDDSSLNKHRDKDAIVFPDKVKQAKDRIAKESNYYISPQSPNEYPSPGPQIVYAVSLAPSGQTSNQAPFLSNTGTSMIQSQPESVQNYPANNVNVQNPQPQYQTNGNIPIGNGELNNIPKNPAYTLVTIPSSANNGVSGNNPAFMTNNPSPSYPPQQANYQPLNSAVQYYMVSINGQNVLVPVNSQNTFPSQNNGQVQYIAVQLQPQNNLQNNNQVHYVPLNQEMVQKPVQNTGQGQVNYVPINSNTVLQMPPQNNPSYSQVSYLPSNSPQIVQVAQQNGPQGSNQVTYVPVNAQTVIQGAPNSPTNSGQVSYVPLNTQNPPTTNQYHLVPLNPQNSGQNNILTLTPANIVSDGNVPLVVFKEKAEVTKKDGKHKKN